MITGILFFTVDDGGTGGLSGGSEEPGLRWLGSVGELIRKGFRNTLWMGFPQTTGRSVSLNLYFGKLLETFH